ncbi:MAG TPA: tyrosine-protein phosphatase, partial [Roseomonas sp.]
SAGKDRTGFGTALILTALGADRATILADYTATERFWRRTHALPDGTPASAARALLGTHPELLEAALDAAIAPYGTADAMLRDALGLDAAKRATLQAALLE